jgi:uncharacterized protein YeaO (DUF488 family)
MLEVWTARISTRDPDVFDVTRKSGHAEFAPSWTILGAILEIRKQKREPTLAEWRDYAGRYLQEMSRSRRLYRPAWDALLARQRVVLTCYCVHSRHCHRRVLARILESLGAVDRGELPKAAPRT